MVQIPTQPIYSYTVYDLSIRSVLSLPELRRDHLKPDVVILIDKIDPLSIDVVYEENDFKISNDGVFLHWKNEADVFIRNGREIIVDPVPGVDERVLRLILLGPVFAILLHQRGILALHAAAVEMAGGAVALMGHQGAGKSALAATLYRRGHGILADDVTAIQFNGDDGPFVLPGFPQLKLWPEVLFSLTMDPSDFPCVEPGFEKRAYRVESRFSQRKLPLRRIYILSERDEKGIHALSPQEVLPELIGHTYRASIVKWVRPEKHFLECASLSRSIPIKRLNRPLSLSILHDVARMIEDDLGQT